MSFIQGTDVVLEAVFTDGRTKARIQPTEVELRISRPDRSLEVRKLSLGTVQYGSVQMGGNGYFAVVDTSGWYGIWHYQFNSTGPSKTFEQKSFTVRKALTAA